MKRVQCDGIHCKRRTHATLRRNQVNGIAEATPADEKIGKLISLATVIDTDDEALYSAAERRARCHIPPGKSDGLGDRLNWEALLAEAPTNEDFHVIAEDSDFRGHGDGIRRYLRKEWEQKKQGQVKLWRRISQFIAAHYPDAESSIELERELAVQKLRSSGTFASTHKAIAVLSQFCEFQESQVLDLLHVLLENDQVHFIATDVDVRTFYAELCHKYSDNIPEDLSEKVGAHINPKNSEG